MNDSIKTNSEINNISERINELKKEKDAVILAHYYVPGEVQDVADFLGDSYYLSKAAAQAPQQTVVFCGVNFMGESAAALCPGKTVLMPDCTADCPMAHMTSEEEIAEARRKYDDLAVVCYINSDASLKMLCDVCVTSANALKVIKALPNKNILMVPDKNLARYTAENIPDKNFIFGTGCCPVHDSFTPEELLACMAEHPSAAVLAHPECTPAVLKHAHYIGSTSGILTYPESSDSNEFIIATENGIMHELQKRYPAKKFYIPSEALSCPGMKLNTLEKLLQLLENTDAPAYRIEISEETASGASAPLQKMLELAAR